MPTPLDGDTAQVGELTLTSPAFADGERMPDWVGYANENENPPLSIDGVPDGTESFVLLMDDEDAEPVVGHVWDHWLTWNLPADTTSIDRAWDPDPEEATVGFNDFVEQGWGGPAPPEGTHPYRFKLFALDRTLDTPPETRKARLGSIVATEAEILGTTQLTGLYDASQGTIF
ncbi:MAG: YbhB/YbcL family Raf kinase inhibitor-like protein [Salinigranum sp.]